MTVPRTLDEWTLDAIEQLVTQNYGEDDSYDFKAVLNSKDRGYTKGIVKAACSFANTDGGFLVFGVSEKGSGTERIVGIPSSREVGKELTDKLRAAEPSIRFELLNPSIALRGGKIVSVVEVPRGLSGPHWDADRKFWKRSQGTAELMTRRELELAFSDYAEQRSRLHLVFLSLADNWSRMRAMRRFDGSGENVSLIVPDPSQLRQHLSVVNSLCPDATESLLGILRVCDAISSNIGFFQPSATLPLSNKAEMIQSYNRRIASQVRIAQPSFEAAMRILGEQFEFEPVRVDGELVPPVRL